MNAEIIAVGDELLGGRQMDTNSSFLSKRLKYLGIKVAYRATVGDSEKDIKSATAQALSRSNIVILMGGLGPTPDDLTKQAVCSLLSIGLEVHEASRLKIENHFLRKGEKMAENNIRQALLPKGCIVLKNDAGLSPGCILKSGEQCIIMLPGPPSELEPMFENGVKPFLKSISDSTCVLKTINVFGMSESLIAQALADIIEKDNPAVATYASDGKTDVSVSSVSSDIKQAVHDVDQTIEEIERRLGDYIYGIDEASLQHAVVSKLVQKKLTVATAESCTGGLFSARITEIPGASVCFGLGLTTYSEDAKNALLGVTEETLSQFGAVSAETACQMSVGVMKRGGTNFGVAITGYAGPASSIGEPVGLVFVSVCSRETVWVKRLELATSKTANRDAIRNLAVMHAMDMLRRVIDSLAVFNAQRIPVSEIQNSNEKSGVERNIILHTISEKDDTEINDLPPTERGIKGILKKAAFCLLPRKADSLGEKIRKSGTLVAGTALIVCICYILGFFFGISGNKNLYNKLARMKTASIGKSVKYPADYLDEFGLLYNENKNIAGWIQISGTQINYPVMQGTNNSYYLNHDFYGKKNRHGVPFVDSRNDIKNLDLNTIIHGNNMKSDNQMFSALENYYKGKQAITFYRQHPLISFDTVYQKMNYKIFAVFTCNINDKNGEVFPYYDMLSFGSTDEFDSFIENVKERSAFNIPVDVKITDRILTLSTCYYEYEGQRLVIMARKVREGEKDTVNVNDVTYNRGGTAGQTSSATVKKDSSGLSRPASSSTSSTVRKPIVISDDSQDDTQWMETMPSEPEQVDIPPESDSEESSSHSASSNSTSSQSTSSQSINSHNTSSHSTSSVATSSPVSTEPSDETQINQEQE